MVRCGATDAQDARVIAAASPTPQPGSPAVDEPGPLADACDYVLEPNLISEAIAPIPYDFVAEHRPEWSADWTFCYVFFNGCTSSNGQCRAAVAISAEPHFVVVTLPAGLQGQPVLEDGAAIFASRRRPRSCVCWPSC